MIGMVLGAVYILSWVLFVWALIDMIPRKDAEFTTLNENNRAKLWWILIALLVPFGAIIYMFVEKRALFASRS